MLLAGDLERSGEAALVAAGADLRADVLELPHHGSRTSSTAAFLDAVGASVALVSAPCFGRFGMPHPEVVERAQRAGMTLWWTGRDGALWIHPFRVRPEHEAAPDERAPSPAFAIWGHAPDAPRCTRRRATP